MDILNAIKQRRSVRTFSNKRVDCAVVEKIIELATWAPSNCNIQGWKFIIVDDDRVKQDMVDMGGATIIKNAPIGILVLYNNQSDNIEYMDYVQSASAAIQNMLLAAYSFGLATCWICHLPTKKDLKRIFGFNSNYSPIAYVLLGYSDREPKKVERKYKIEDLISYNCFNFKKDTLAKTDKKLWLRKLMRKLYYLLPGKIKTIINPFIDKNFVNKFEN